MEQLDQEMLLLCYQLYGDIAGFLSGTQFRITKTAMFPSEVSKIELDTPLVPSDVSFCFEENSHSMKRNDLWGYRRWIDDPV